MSELREQARECLLSADADEKLAAVRALSAAGGKLLDISSDLSPVAEPGRPDRPELVAGSRVPRRSFSSRQGRAVLMHAIAHIEFNAVNLALDAICRFSGMPEKYYTDWLRVAEEEAYHFDLVRAHLRHLGMDYGDCSAHAGLWDMCEKTADDVLDRMALVPSVLEARGLDVTPGIQDKLAHAGDAHAVSILDVILRDEIGHVAIGSHWFHYLCDQRGLDPVSAFRGLLEKHYPKGLFGPFNLDAREQAGFTKREMAMFRQK